MIDPEFSNATVKKPEERRSDWEGVLKRSLIGQCVALLMTAALPLYLQALRLAGHPPPRNPEPELLMMAGVYGFVIGLVLAPLTLVVALITFQRSNPATFHRGEFPAVIAASLGMLVVQFYAIMPLVQ